MHPQTRFWLRLWRELVLLKGESVSAAAHLPRCLCVADRQPWASVLRCPMLVRCCSSVSRWSNPVLLLTAAVCTVIYRVDGSNQQRDTVYLHSASFRAVANSNSQCRETANAFPNTSESLTSMHHSSQFTASQIEHHCPDVDQSYDISNIHTSL